MISDIPIKNLNMNLYRDEYLILAKLALSANLLLSGQKIRYSRQPFSHRSTTKMVRSRVTSRCATPLGDPRGIPKRIRNSHLQSEITKHQLRNLCAHSPKVCHSTKVIHKSKLQSLLSFIACDGPMANPGDIVTMADFDDIDIMDLQFLDDSNPISDNNDFGYLSNFSEDDVSALTEQSLSNLIDTPNSSYNEISTQVLVHTQNNALPNNIAHAQAFDSHKINTQECIENYYLGLTSNNYIKEQYPNTQFTNTPSTSCIVNVPLMTAPSYNGIEYGMVPTTNSTQGQYDTINYQSTTDFQPLCTNDNITDPHSSNAYFNSANSYIENIPQMIAPNYNVVMINGIEYRMVPTTNSTQKQYDIINYESTTDFQPLCTNDNITDPQSSKDYFNSADLQSLNSVLSPSSISSRSTSTDSPTSPSLFSQEAALLSTSTKPEKSPRRYKNPEFQPLCTNDKITDPQSSKDYFTSAELQSLNSTLSSSSISSRSTSTYSHTSPSSLSQEAALPSTSTKPAKSPRRYKNPAKVRVDNNKACDRYRQRKKEADIALRYELEILKGKNNELKTQWTNLHKELDGLQTKIIKKYITCNTFNNVNKVIL